MKPVPEFDRPAPDLVIWGDYDSTVRCDCRSAAVKVDAGWLVFDPVPLADEAWQAVLDEGPVAGIVLTSGNHQRESENIRQRFGVTVYAPAAARANLTADAWVEPGGQVHGFRLHALPGAGPGESAWCDGRTLVIGDAIINLSGLEVLPYKYCSDAASLRGSLRGLAGLKFERVVFAHGLPLVEDAHRRMAGFVLEP